MSVDKNCFQVRVGETVSFTKTVSESDVYLFAGITGDFAAVHVDENFMKKSVYGRRIAHGVMIVGFMSTTSSLIVKGKIERTNEEVPVSLGYDRIRFIKPVFFGDTITVTYRIVEIDLERRRSKSEVTAINQNSELVCSAQHILKWVQK